MAVTLAHPYILVPYPPFSPYLLPFLVPKKKRKRDEKMREQKKKME
jgi:hypothetical protein